MGAARRSLAAAALTAMTLLAALVGAAPAHAATNPYTARGACGSSYTQTVATHKLGSKAVMYLLYSPSTDYECAVTLKTSQIGTATTTEAWILAQGGTWRSDKAKHKYYAGPLRQRVDKRCTAYAGGHGGVNWTSGWVRCRFFPTMTASTTGASATCQTWTSNRGTLSNAYTHFRCSITDTKSDLRSARVQYQLNNRVGEKSNTAGSGQTVTQDWVTWDDTTAHQISWRTCGTFSCTSWVSFTV